MENCRDHWNPVQTSGRSDPGLLTNTILALELQHNWIRFQDQRGESEFTKIAQDAVRISHHAVLYGDWRLDCVERPNVLLLITTNELINEYTPS